MKPPLRKKHAVALVVVAAVSAVGIAVAAWSTSGSGTGYAKAGTSGSLTLGSAVAETSATLYPGATGAATIKVTNPNPFPVKITQVTMTSGTIATAGGDAACDAATGVTFNARTGLALALGANSTGTFDLPGAVSMSNASVDECQGEVFTIPVQVLGVSDAS